MNFLGALGGIGQGITAGVKDWRDADAEKQKQDENALRMKVIQQGMDIAAKGQERKDKEWTKEDSFKENMTKLFLDQPEATPIDASSVDRVAKELTTPASGGISYLPKTAVEPKTFSDSVSANTEQNSIMQRPTSPIVSQGISLDRFVQPQQPKQPKQVDELGRMNKAIDLAMKHGQWDHAFKFNEWRTGLESEKVKHEEKQRSDVAMKARVAFEGKDPGKFQAAMSAVSDMFPDGNNVKSARFLPDGKVEIAYGDNPPVILDQAGIERYLASFEDSKTYLGALHNQRTLALQSAHNKAVEGNLNADNKRADENHKLAVDEHKQSEANKKELKNLQVRYALMGDGTPPETKKLWRAKIVSLGGKDPEDKQDGDYKGMMNEEGKMVIYSGKSGDVKQNSPNAAGVAQPKTMEEWKALPSGTSYIDPNSGKTAVKR